MSKPHRKSPLFSLQPVSFRNSEISGRGVFAKRAFEPGETIVAYAPKQRRVARASAEALAAADTKLTLVSEQQFVIIPDTSVSGGWLCNHSCAPNAAIYSDAAGRVQCTRHISPGEEVTIFYGWVTHNDAARDPCRCGAASCRRFINFDLSDDDVEHRDGYTIPRPPLAARLDAYAEFLATIGQEQVFETVLEQLARIKPPAS